MYIIILKEQWTPVHCSYLIFRRIFKMSKKQKDRVSKAQDRALERLDYILETIPAPDFVEIVGRMGGDTITYRVYDDGSMYER